MTPHGNLKVAARGDLEIEMKRVFNTSRSLLFDALTRPELVKRWMYGPEGHSLPVCEIDLTVGGALRYVWRLPDGTEMGMTGRYLEIVRPERIVHTELFDEDWTGGETLVTTELYEQGETTLLEMTVRYPSLEARDRVIESGMSEGVAMGYDRLDVLLPTIAVT
ncbi:MAG: SRPBCC family protein [Acidobacteriota bacterium]